MTNVAEMLRQTAARIPDQRALTYQGAHLSWATIYTRSAGLCSRIRTQGLTRGQHIAIYTGHCPAQVIAIFGTALADAAFIIIHPLLKENQIKHQVNDANVQTILTTEDRLQLLQELFKYRKIHFEILTTDGLLPGSNPEQPDEPIPTHPVTEAIPTDVGCIIYTSGSTGRPKGVVVPHRTLLDGARIVSGYLKITEQDTLLSVLPYNFDYGLNQLLSVVFVGARVVLHKFSLPHVLIKTLVEEKVTGLAAVPAMWPHLLNPKLLSSEIRPNFEHLRYITTAGGKHSQELLRQLTGFFPNTSIIIMYGLTESFRSTYLPFSELFKRPGSIGKAVPEVQIMVLNKRGELCQPGEKGELIHRGAFVTYGYLNDPDLTNQKFIPLETGGRGSLPEMAVRSGDIVSLDEDGFIYFHGRADMQIKCSGYRISSSEVEEAAALVPGLRHAAAFGLADEQSGESVNLAYSTHNGEELNGKVLTHSLNRILPSYAVPRRIRFYPHIPLTTTGKINYAALKRDFEESSQQKNSMPE
jgi:acyl-CoA synthetase (AMP-forming)/AMP-acid ligase II